MKRESERQRRVRDDIEKGYTPAEARGREAAREAGYSPPTPHPHGNGGTVGHKRPGPK